MARFKCKNCGNLFSAHVVDTTYTDSNLRLTCPKCGSKWTEYVGPDNEWGGWIHYVCVPHSKMEMMQTSKYRAWRSGWQG
jgi:DNA-directed RNA polymerase subunit RPC12/RpoP